MNCERVREQLPVLLDDRLASAAATEIRTHLEGCNGCRHDFTALSETLAVLDTMPASLPSPRLRAKVYAAITAEQHALRAGPPAGAATAQPHPPAARSTWFWLLQPLGALVVLTLGFVLGVRSALAPDLKSMPAQSVAELSTQRELAALRSKVESMSQLVGYSLLQQSSRSSNERLRGILASANLEQPDDKVINDLIGALALDPSVNIRLNALEALYAHADQAVVRTGVLASLPREQSPLVQVSMIDFLVASRDREAAPTLQQLSDNAQINRDVRAAAKRALTQL